MFNIRINMQITNICGTFNSATDLEMSHIEVSNRTLESIDLVNENATFVIEACVDAVQTHNAKEAIKSAWGIDVNIGSNGSLSLN